jgi:hypothetical protein
MAGEGRIGGAPYPHQRIQRAIPAPFQRPSISAGGDGKKRNWQQTMVADLVAGDIVADFGKIESVRLDFRVDPYEWRVTIINPDGVERTYNIHDSVLAFTA